jgi:hypothetical protein
MVEAKMERNKITPNPNVTSHDGFICGMFRRPVHPVPLSVTGFPQRHNIKPPATIIWIDNHCPMSIPGEYRALALYPKAELASKLA